MEKNESGTWRLSHIEVKGFKSIGEPGAKIELGAVNVFLGANGAGKSNLISLFSFLGAILEEKLQNYVGKAGGANMLLHYGAKKTRSIDIIIGLEFKEANTYLIECNFLLGVTAVESLFIEIEDIRIKYPNNKIVGIPGKFVEGGSKETTWFNRAASLIESANSLDETDLPENFPKEGFKNRNEAAYRLIRSTLFQLHHIEIFQFHDTSANSKLRSNGYVEDNQVLHNDGGNLAAFLYGLQTRSETRKYYNRIIRHIQQVMPEFGDFDLQPSVLNRDYIRLNWKEDGNEYLFGPHQLSDGTLRFMALATLLLQPSDSIPPVILLDEPEIGLHPAAITLLAGMVRMASRHAQVILATQSTRLVDEFKAEEVVIVERDPVSKSSLFKRLDPEALNEWLEQYSLSELWEKNVLGGRP